MPIEPKVVLDYLGIDPDKFEDDTQFKEAFNEEWVKLSEAPKVEGVRKQVFGGINGTLRTKIKQAFKEHGLEPPHDLDKQDPADLIPALNALVKDTYTTQVAELKKQVDAKGTGQEEWDRKQAELQKKIEAHAQEAKNWETKYGTLESTVKQREHDAKVNAEWDSAKRSIKWKQGLDAFTQDGFMNAMRESYQIQFDENGAPYCVGKDGNRIANPDKASTFLSLGEVLASKAKEHKLDATNPHGGEPVQRPTVTQPTQPNQPPAGATRTVNRPAHLRA